MSLAKNGSAPISCETNGGGRRGSPLPTISGSNKNVNPLLDAALSYAARNWSVFPLAPGSKVPLKGSRGYLDATADQEAIRAWWNSTPTANIGLACGTSGIAVVDPDMHGEINGLQGLRAIEADHEPLPTAPMVMTPNHGLHLYFADPQKTPKAKLAEGVDLQAAGSYVVAPPSRLADGRSWSWAPTLSPDDLEPPALPQWIHSKAGGNGTHHNMATAAPSECAAQSTFLRDWMQRHAGYFQSLGVTVSDPKDWDIAERVKYTFSPCPWNRAHLTGSYAGVNEHGAVVAACAHNGCPAEVANWGTLKAAAGAWARAQRRVPAPAGGEGDQVVVVDPLDAIRALKPGAQINEIGEALRAAADGLQFDDPLARAMGREELVRILKKLGIQAPGRAVDAALTEEMADDHDDADSGGAMALADPEVWPDPVDGAVLLGELKATIERFVVLPEQSAVAAALWILHAHAHAATDISPFLALLSPEKRCGKTTMLQVVGALSPRRLFASNITPAALFRSVEKYQPTLLIDEGDTFLRDNEELRGILNSGHTKTTAFVIRTVGDDHEPRQFRTWCPKLIALIGRLKDTLEDRSIVIPLRRKAPAEVVERLRADRLDALDPLCRRAWTWAQQHLEELRMHEPVVPAELHDRAADNWRPLLAVAELVGGDWPAHARSAAVALSCADPEDTESVREMLLVDIQSIFVTRKADKLFGETLVADLLEMDGRPWPEFGRGGRPITKTKLARLLAPFAIHTKAIRIGGERAKGYEIADFEDAWARYTPLTKRDNVTSPINIDESAFSKRDTDGVPGSPVSRFESAKTPENIGLSRCHALKGGVLGTPPLYEEGEV